MYIAVVAKKDGKYKVARIDSTSLKVIDCNVVDEPTLVRGSAQGIPVNYSVDKGTGKIKETMGSFSRLSDKTFIVLQELSTKTGTIVGYRLLNPSNGSIIAKKKEDIVAYASKSDKPLLQNGIIRSGRVNCYPDSPFQKCIIGVKKKPAVRKPEHIRKVPEDVNKVNPESKPTSGADLLSQFSKEQKKELALAKKNGVNLRIIANPKLTPEQMRVIWLAKKDGVYSEYFANPEMSVDCMKLYSAVLTSKRMVKECSLLLSKPELEYSCLYELYASLASGLDYTQWIGLDASNIREKREIAEKTLWDTDDEVSSKESDMLGAKRFVRRLARSTGK